jgi:hypothetical protein
MLISPMNAPGIYLVEANLPLPQLAGRPSFATPFSPLWLGLYPGKGEKCAGPSLVSRVGTLSAFETVFLVAALLMLGLLAGQLCLLAHMLRQDGRLLVRVEALETAFAPGGPQTLTRSRNGDNLWRVCRLVALLPPSASRDSTGPASQTQPFSVGELRFDTPRKIFRIIQNSALFNRYLPDTRPGWNAEPRLTQDYYVQLSRYVCRECTA